MDAQKEWMWRERFKEVAGDIKKYESEVPFLEDLDNKHQFIVDRWKPILNYRMIWINYGIGCARNDFISRKYLAPFQNLNLRLEQLYQRLGIEIPEVLRA
ncbi:hypothetical protein J4217_04815 [Candidatus Pacearchaeota archaeon]|nr:hypothetical protein [Candidatus Pacearchaeota archaeon]